MLSASTAKCGTSAAERAGATWGRERRRRCRARCRPMRAVRTMRRRRGRTRRAPEGAKVEGLLDRKTKLGRRTEVFAGAQDRGWEGRVVYRIRKMLRLETVEIEAIGGPLGV